MRRRTEIITYTDRVIVISGQMGLQSWCSVCGRQNRILPPEQAAVVAGVDVATILHWVDAGRLHSAGSHGGLIYICLTSLCGNGSSL